MCRYERGRGPDVSDLWTTTRPRNDMAGKRRRRSSCAAVLPCPQPMGADQRVFSASKLAATNASAICDAPDGVLRYQGAVGSASEGPIKAAAVGSS